LYAFDLNAQVKIHAHNDYERSIPFHGAMQARVYSIEADIFPVDSLLCVAHHIEKVNRSITLDKLYLQPLIKYYLSATSSYSPVLMIDIKQDHKAALKLLQNKLAKMEQELKQNGINNMPLFVISGDRPEPSSFNLFPYYIQFDGRPDGVYSDEALKKIAIISNAFSKYSKWTGNGRLASKDKANIKKLAHQVHDQGKLLRLWAIPDTPKAWKKLHKLGVDIINTDYPFESDRYFNKKRNE
jgi:alkaline phosphatase